MPRKAGPKLFRRVKLKSSTKKCIAKNKARKKGSSKIKTS